MSSRAMNTPVIHVHTQTDKHTQAYTTFMWETMRALANHPDKLRLSVHCMGPTATERLASLPQTKTYHVPNISNDQGLVGSVGHGACVEHALSLTDDGDIHIIADSDTVMLAKGWDDYVRYQLIDNDTGTFGTTYEDIGGFTSGAGDVQTYKDAPNVVWMALSPLHRWQDLRALPEKSSNLTITDAGMSKIYGLPIGNHVLRDVAWQIPEYLSNRAISYIGLKQLKPSSDASIVLKGLSDYHEEYHVGEVPFVVHHRGSMKYAYRSDTISVNFYKAVDAWLVEEHKRPARWVWMPDAESDKKMLVLNAMRLQSRDRIQAIEATAGKRAEERKHVAVAVDVKHDDVISSGWAKITYGNKLALSRHAQPVPQSVDVPLDVNEDCTMIRVEGTVQSRLNVVLPAVVDNKPYRVIARNMTPGTVNFSSAIEGRNCSCELPIGACWLLLVDVDGVVHVS